MLKQYKRQLVFANKLQTMIKLPFNFIFFRFFHVLKIRNLTCLTLDQTHNLTIVILRDYKVVKSRGSSKPLPPICFQTCRSRISVSSSRSQLTSRASPWASSSMQATARHSRRATCACGSGRPSRGRGERRLGEALVVGRQWTYGISGDGTRM